MGAGICLGNGILCTGTGIHEEKNNRKMGMGFQFAQHRLGLWDLSWDLKKTNSWEMGLGPPLHDPLDCQQFRSIGRNLFFSELKLLILTTTTTTSTLIYLHPELN